MSNLSAQSTFNLSICGGNVGFTDNYVSFNSTAITVNGTQYPLYLGKLRQLIGLPFGKCYLELVSVSYLYALKTVTVGILVNTTAANALDPLPKNTTPPRNQTPNFAQTANFSTGNTVLTFTSNSAQAQATNTVLENDTNATPSIAGYSKLFSISANFPYAPNATIAVLTHYPCQLQSNAISPYALLSDTWNAINAFTSNAQTCTIGFTLPQSHVFALFELLPSQQTTISVSTTEQTTSSVPTPQQNASQSTIGQQLPTQNSTGGNLSNTDTGTPLIVGVVLFIVVLIAALMIKARKKPDVIVTRPASAEPGPARPQPPPPASPPPPGPTN